MNIVDIKEKLFLNSEEIKLTCSDNSILVSYRDLLFPIVISVNKDGKVIFSYRIYSQLLFLMVVLLSVGDSFFENYFLMLIVLFFSLVIPIGIIISEIRVRFLSLIISVNQ